MISEIRLENDNLPAIDVFEISHSFSLNMLKENLKKCFVWICFLLLEQSQNCVCIFCNSKAKLFH